MSLYPGNPYYYFYLLSVFLFILVFYIEELFKARKLNTCNDAINLEWSSTQTFQFVLSSTPFMLHNIGQLTHTLKPHPNLENILGYLKDSNAAERYFRDQEPENYQPRNDCRANPNKRVAPFRLWYDWAPLTP